MLIFLYHKIEWAKTAKSCPASAVKKNFNITDVLLYHRYVVIKSQNACIKLNLKKTKMIAHRMMPAFKKAA